MSYYYAGILYARWTSLNLYKMKKLMLLRLDVRQLWPYWDHGVIKSLNSYIYVMVHEWAVYHGPIWVHFEKKKPSTQYTCIEAYSSVVCMDTSNKLNRYAAIIVGLSLSGTGGMCATAEDTTMIYYFGATVEWQRPAIKICGDGSGRWRCTTRLVERPKHTANRRKRQTSVHSTRT